jgi:hypothetical protein
MQFSVRRKKLIVCSYWCLLVATMIVALLESQNSVTCEGQPVDCLLNVGVRSLPHSISDSNMDKAILIVHTSSTVLHTLLAKVLLLLYRTPTHDS